jgi:DNA-binding response OmpR family regulator
MASGQSVALVLEDTDLGRWALTRALEARGFDVRIVLTWAEASAWLPRVGFTLALVAVSSPGEAAEVAAEVRLYRRTHLVLLAGEDIADDVRMACGPEPDILAKPFTLDQIERIVASRQESGSEARRA